MPIAIDTSPANAITDISDLVRVVRRRMDDDGYDISAIYTAITEAEEIFNRQLRCPTMEKEVTLAVTEESTDLPLDFLQLRQIYSEGSPDNPLTATSPAVLRSTYQGVAGTPCAYAIENRRLVVAPVGNATVTMLYYARIPALTDANPSNWMLEENPGAYIRMVLAILFDEIGDNERAMLNESRALAILEAINQAGVGNRWGAAPLTPQGMRQVRGART